MAESDLDTETELYHVDDEEREALEALQNMQAHVVSDEEALGDKVKKAAKELDPNDKGFDKAVSDEVFIIDDGTDGEPELGGSVQPGQMPPEDQLPAWAQELKQQADEWRAEKAARDRQMQIDAQKAELNKKKEEIAAEANKLKSQKIAVQKHKDARDQSGSYTDRALEVMADFDSKISQLHVDAKFIDQEIEGLDKAPPVANDPEGLTKFKSEYSYILDSNDPKDLEWRNAAIKVEGELIAAGHPNSTPGFYDAVLENLKARGFTPRPKINSGGTLTNSQNSLILPTMTGQKAQPVAGQVQRPKGQPTGPVGGSTPSPQNKSSKYQSDLERRMAKQFGNDKGANAEIYKSVGGK